MKPDELQGILDSHREWLTTEGGVKANLSGADLSRADLSWANLSGADLSWANLSWADLSWANLSRADLSRANLSRANLSGATGLLQPFGWLRDTFETTAQGFVVYRAQRGQFSNPDGWVFEPGAILTEVCHSDRALDCACGVAFATLDWVREKHPRDIIWRCLIPWQRSCGIVVPYNTDGKARCDYLELVEVVEA